MVTVIFDMGSSSVAVAVVIGLFIKTEQMAFGIDPKLLVSPFFLFLHLPSNGKVDLIGVSHLGFGHVPSPSSPCRLVP